MPLLSDPSSPPSRSRDWFRLTVACVTNFAVLAAPCHAFPHDGMPAMAPYADDLLLSALLLGGDPFPQPERVSPFVWEPAPARKCWRSPELRPAPAVSFRAAWSLPVQTVGVASPSPWQPAAPPAGIDPAPAPGVFGALPIEQEIGNGIVTGEVSDSTTFEPIKGAIVDIIGTGRTAETDAQGRFRIDGLPAGDFIAEASALNYSAVTMGVSPNPSGPVELRFGLKIKPAESGTEEYQLEEETVSIEYNENSQGDFNLSLSTEAPTITGTVGKEEFSRSGISDAGEAVSKISGANIVGGKYAVVRGLGDRYSNTLVNGAQISSADPSKKAVQLDLFPSDLLQSVSIYKTFVPELPAEFAGGTVAIETLRFPEKPLIEFEYGRTFNPELDGDFYGSGTDLGYFGRVDDTPPAIPSLESGGFTAGTTSGRPPTSTNPVAQRAIRHATALHQSSPLLPTLRDSKHPESFSVTLGKTFDLGNDLELGVVVAGTAGNGDKAIRGAQVGRSLNPGADGTTGTGDDYLNRTQEEDRYTSYAGYGLLGSIGLRSGTRHNVNLTLFQNHKAEDEVIRARKIADDTGSSGEFPDYAGPGTLPTGELNPLPFGATARTYRALDSTIPLRRTLTFIQGNGHHEVGDDEHPIELDWSYARSESVEDRPGTRTAFFTELDFTDPSIRNIDGAVYDPSLGRVYTLWDIVGATPALSQSFREFLKTEEASGNSRLDLTFPLWSDGDDHFKLKLGGSHYDRSREIRGRLFTYNIGGALNDLLGSEDGGQYGVDFLRYLNGLLSPNGNPFFLGHANDNTSNNIFIEENTRSGNTVRNVDAGTILSSGYVQGSWSIGDWDMTGGFRYESEDRSFEVFQNLNPGGTGVPFTTISNDYILPGLTLNRTFGRDDTFNTMLAWSRTVARPTFFEFAPIRTQDQASGDTFQGNPNLTDTLIDNYDLRLEWTPQPETAIAASFFHKQLDSPIAQAFAFGDRTFINGDTGTLQGIELETRHRFLENWSLTANYTYIDSLLEFQQPPSQTIQTTFDGQPSHIFNLIFGWDHKPSGWAATLNYNFTGSYLTAVPLSSVEPPVRREAYSQLDLIVQKTFEFQHGVGIVKLNCGNLLDSTDTQSFDGTGLIYSSYKPGRTYGVEVEYRF
jgi:TonB-dependent receptor